MSIRIGELGITEDVIYRYKHTSFHLSLRRVWLPLYFTTTYLIIAAEPTSSPVPNLTIVNRDELSNLHDSIDWSWSLRWNWLVINVALLVIFISSVTMIGIIISIAHHPIDTKYHISDSHFPNSCWPIVLSRIKDVLFSLVLFSIMEDFGIIT